MPWRTSKFGCISAPVWTRWTPCGKPWGKCILSQPGPSPFQPLPLLISEHCHQPSQGPWMQCQVRTQHCDLGGNNIIPKISHHVSAQKSSGKIPWRSEKQSIFGTTKNGGGKILTDLFLRAVWKMVQLSFQLPIMLSDLVHNHRVPPGKSQLGSRFHQVLGWFHMWGGGNTPKNLDETGSRKNHCKIHHLSSGKDGKKCYESFTGYISWFPTICHPIKEWWFSSWQTCQVYRQRDMARSYGLQIAIPKDDEKPHWSLTWFTC